MLATELPGLVEQAQGERRPLAVGEVAAAPRVSSSHAYRLVASGRLRGVGIGEAIRVHPATVGELLAGGLIDA